MSEKLGGVHNKQEETWFFPEKVKVHAFCKNCKLLPSRAEHNSSVHEASGVG